MSEITDKTAESSIDNTDKNIDTKSNECDVKGKETAESAESANLKETYGSKTETKENDDETVDEDVGFQEIEINNLDIQKEVCKDVEENGGIEQIAADSERKEGDHTEKSNYGEMKTDIAMSEEGWSRISENTVTSLDDPIQKGIDGVYERVNDQTGETEYCIVESKYGSSQLGETDDGKQMNENWIDKRLDDAVGKEKADEIREQQIENPDNVTSRLSRVDSEGNVDFNDLDSEGNLIKEEENRDA